MKRFQLFLLCAFLACDAAAQNCNPLDHTFGNAGISHVFGGGSIDAGKIAVQADNKILQLYYNYSNPKFRIARHKSNGGLDSSFGINGIAETAVGGNAYPHALAVQTDGKIVVAGYAYNGNTAMIALVRYHSNGTLDISFGTNGMVMTGIGQSWSVAYAVTIQSDGKILAAGSTADNYYTSSYAVVRYHPNGTLDNSFGQSGTSVFHLGPLVGYVGTIFYGRYANEHARVIKLQPDGKIIVGGTSYALFNCYDYYGGVYCDEAMGLTRLNSNGSIDLTFGINGVIRDSLGLRSASAISLQQDGKILVTGYGYQPVFVVERYKTDGVIDSTFGTNGKVVTSVGLANCEANSIAVNSNGRIIVSGMAYNHSLIGVARLLPGGDLDASFNNGGSAVLQVDQVASGSQAMALQADATVLSVRSTAGGANEKISVIRLSDSGPGALTPVITAGGPLTFCNGGNVRLASDQAGAIQWFRNNSVIAGAIDIAYVASQTGSYTVLVSNANGCGISSPVNVTVRNNPPTPPMNWSTPQFSTTAGYINYEWFLNNTIIAGVDSNVFKPTQTGEYKVIVTDNFGCKTSSDKFILRILAVNDIVIGDSKINYYPNPVQTILTIDVTNPYLNKLEAQLYDVSGKLVYKQSLDRSRNQLGLQKLPTGVYQLIIRNEAGKVSVKIFVTR